MSTDPANAIPAATLVIFRRPDPARAAEILMVVRSRQLAFAGGMAVFPGGRVDPGDREMAAYHADAMTVDEAAHRIAAIRETIEETGLVVGMHQRVGADQAAQIRAQLVADGVLAPVLERFSLTLDLGSLIPYARWWPKGMKHTRIFDTRFYLSDLGTGAVDVAVDTTENTRLFWTSAAEALRRADRGEIDVIFPTRRNLERLAQFESFEGARKQAETVPIRTISPTIEQRDGRPVLSIPDDLGYPVTFEELDSARRG
ncbi:NUDIX hydrolase [Qipengyuania algicida]|uniref:NUDIX hydrolase n=1 Tax=Qipengyuania algicida TaxID=1836209 RepID=UPI0019267369|nr:NUDIX domain-containing protein [Qipengyuania algicida]